MKTPRFWKQKNILSTLLLPLSALYAAGFALDRYRTPKQRASLPVISVGNITAGGAGKTPTTMALVALLRELGEVPHIVTRGYGGKQHHAHRVVDSDTAEDVGDEAILLARHAPTWVGASRFASAQAAHAAGATLVIADDALQHHALAHDLSILVVDLASGFGNARLLPAGPLRQTLESAYGNAPTVTVAIGENDPHHLMPKLMVHGDVWRADWQPAVPMRWLHEGKWLAFAGIAYPGKFYATLQRFGAAVAETHDFADHHPYTRGELEALAARATQHGARLITTEKDAVRIPAAWGIPIAVVPVTLGFSERDTLKAALANWRSGT